MVNWIRDRIVERTSWDGGVLIAVGVVGLFFSNNHSDELNLLCSDCLGEAFTLWKSEG